MPATLASLRRFAVARSLFPPTTLDRALDAFGFVQADPIRAPARAQELTLRHRVHGYRVGDLDRQYEALEVEEDVFINYGFVPRAVHALMHPRAGGPLPAPRSKRAAAILDFVRQRGAVHPREVDQHFSHGRVTNYWGGSSNATTHLLDALHYRGLLRVVRREAGIRVYGAREPMPAQVANSGRAARLDALVDVAVGTYAPLSAASLATLVARLRYAVPQWRGELRAALQRARQRLACARIEGVDWYWPAGESRDVAPPDGVRLLAPFDPIVWDRRRFEALWGWDYRFEAYTPAGKRRFGYYALPMLWGEHVIGWGNVSVVDARLQADIGYIAGPPPRERGFSRALEAELDRLRAFLGLSSDPP